MSRWIGLALLLVVVGALALRLPDLDRRPMHNDEAVNAHLIQKLWEDGLYKYNPDEYHGPTLHYATLPFIWLSGANDFTEVNESILRLGAVIFGVILILLLWWLADGLAPSALVYAAILTAVSPAMVFYSRYFIHEMLLVCFSMGAIGAGWRYIITRRARWAILTGASVGLMYATKETFVIALGAMVLAAGLVMLWERYGSKERVAEPVWWNWKHDLLAVGSAVFVSVVLFTAFFTDPAGPLNSIKTYLPWLERAGGASPHIHPPQFYLERLAWFDPPGKGPSWSEGLILVLAVVGMVGALIGKGLGGTNRALARFLTIYTIILTAAYSAISYKTPWCMLGFLHGMILLAGFGATVLLRVLRFWPLKIVMGLVLLAATAQLGWQAWQTSFVHSADWRNPYVYAQTVPDILKMVQRVQEIAQVTPRQEREFIKVIAPNNDSWPLPWYFRNFTRAQVGYYDDIKEIEKPFPIMIVGAAFRSELDEKTNKKWLSVGYFALRPKVYFEMFVNFDLWKNYIENRPKPKDEE